MSQTVVAVDNPPVKVVCAADSEFTAVKLDHRPQVGRQHRQHRANHPLRFIAAAAECLHHLQLLACFFTALSRIGAGLFQQFITQFVKVNLFNQPVNCLGTHSSLKYLTVLIFHILVMAFSK